MEGVHQTDAVVMGGGIGRIMRYAAESARHFLLEPVAAKLDAEESKVREEEERREEMRSTYVYGVGEGGCRQDRASRAAA